MPKRKAKRPAGRRSYENVSRYDAVRRTPDLLDTYDPPVQRALPLGQPSRANPLRHVAEYLKYQRHSTPERTSKINKGFTMRSGTYWAEHNKRLLRECERRKARREVLHASGHAGSRKRYRVRKAPGPKGIC